MLMRQIFHSVILFQIQVTERYIAFRPLPQECPVTSGIKKGKSSECSSIVEKSANYRFF